jgi:8-oxo-dGTP pyrophosphatase MutT (NUDIX family)
MILKNISKILSDKHLIGTEKYFKASVAIPIFIKDQQEHIIFEKRAAEIRQGGEVSLPGGECENYEDDSSVTAIRETCEELGIQKEKIIYLGKFGQLITPFGALIDVHIVQLLILEFEELNFDKTEVELVFSLPVNFFIENQPEVFYAKAQVIPIYTDENGNQIELFPAKKFNLPEKYSKPWGTHKHRILVYKSEPEIVWGMTAEIIYDFIQKVKGTI